MADEYKILASTTLADSDAAVLYNSPADKSALISSISVTNTNTTDQEFSLYAYDTVVTSQDVQPIDTTKIYAVSNTGYKYSANGSTWNSFTFPAMYYGGIKSNFYEVPGGFWAADTYIPFYSTDGLTWTRNWDTYGNYDAWNSSAQVGAWAYFKGVYTGFLYGYDTYYTSTDEVTWSMNTLGDWSFWYNLWSSDIARVATGVNNAVMVASEYSTNTTDGSSWSYPYNFGWASGTGGRVAYGNGRFVAVGTGYYDNIKYAQDAAWGINWNYTNFNPFGLGYFDGQSWTGVAYAGGKFAVVGNINNNYDFSGNTVLTSTDGEEWQVGTLPATQVWDVIGYGGGFMAFRNAQSGQGASNVVYTSPDGITWTMVTASSGTYVQIYNTLGGLTTYTPTPSKALYKNAVIKADSTELIEPGITLNNNDTLLIKGSAGISASVFGAEVDGVDTYKILGQAAVAGTASAVYSAPQNTSALVRAIHIANTGDSDAVVSLSAGIMGPSDSFSEVAVLMMGDNNSVSSPVAVKKLSGPIPASGASLSYAESLVFGNGVFLATFGPSIYRSVNGADWTEPGQTASTWQYNPGWQGNLAYGNGVFVWALSYDDAYLGHAPTRVSTDGLTWTYSTEELAWSTLTYGNGVFLAKYSGSTTVKTSTDGLTWTSAGTVETDFQNNTTVIYGNGRFIMQNQAGRTWSDNNGQSWQWDSPNPSYSYEAVFNKGIFVGVSTWTHQVSTSTDGLTWSLSTGIPSSDEYYRVAKTSSGFVAASSDGASGMLLWNTSTDGLTWEQSTKSVLGSAGGNAALNNLLSSLVPNPVPAKEHVVKDIVLAKGESVVVKSGITLGAGDSIAAYGLGSAVISVFGMELP